MKIYIYIIALTFLNFPAHASSLFDNGTAIDASNPTLNNTFPNFTIFDDFQLIEDSTITSINYSIFTKLASNYNQSNISILDSFGGSSLFTFSVFGNISSNGLTTSNNNVPNGFDLTLNGLNINLLAGTYVLGLSTEIINGDLASIGSGDSGFGSALFLNSNPRPDHLSFSIEGSTVSSVPVPAAVWLFGSGLVGLLGMRKKVKVATLSA